MVMKSVGFALKTDGKATVKNDFAEVGQSGKSSMEVVATAAEDAGERAAKAAETFADRQVAAWKRQAAAAKVAAAGAEARGGVDSALAGEGNNGQFATVNFDRATGGAKAAAAAFEELFRAEDEAAASARKVQAAMDAATEARAEVAANRSRSAIDQALASGVGGVNLDRSNGAARDSAAAIEAELRLEEDRAAALAKVRAALDPLSAAQERYNSELRLYDSLLGAGGLSEEEHAAAVAMSTRRLREAEVASKGLGNAHQSASIQTMMLQSAIFRAGESLSSGMPVMRIAAQQGMEVAEAFTMGSAALSGGWTIAITGAIALLGVLGPKLFDSANASDQLAAHQKSLADVLDSTTGRIKEQNAALLLHQSILAAGDAQNARRAVDQQRQDIAAQIQPAFQGQTTYGMGGQLTDQDPRIVQAMQTFGKNGDGGVLAKSLDAIGHANPKLKDKTDELIGMAASYVQATRSAEQLEAQQRLLAGVGRPGDQKLARGQFGADAPDLSLADAEAKLAAATTKRQKAEAQAEVTRIKGQKTVNDGTMSLADYTAAMTKVDAAVNTSSEHTDRHAQSLARDAASMDVNARAALDVADAYLKSSAAGVQADAIRKASTDATKKGIDVEAQARRQLDLQVAEGAANGAKSVAQLRDETAARAAVNDNVRDGKLAVADINQALSDESALRPLLALQAISQGDAYKKLTEIITAYRAALGNAHAEEARSDAAQSIEQLKRQAEDAQLQARFAGDTSGAYERAKAALDANRQADDKHYGTGDRASVVNSADDAAVASQHAAHANSGADALRTEQDRLKVYQAQFGALGKSTDEQDRIVSRLQLQLQLARSLGADYDQFAPAILAAHDAADAMNQKLKVAAAAMDELKGFGEQLVDDASRAKSWGDLWKSVINDVKQEMLKLLFINPLKNLIEGGNSNATIGSVIKAIGSVFGGAGHNATGTDYWSGGMTWVAENGPELINLPRGSRVSNAADTRRMFGNDNGAGGNTHYYDLRGAVVYEDLMKKLEARSQLASAQGAAGGRVLSRQDSVRSARKRLGTRV